MKKGAFFVNGGRGSAVVENDLIAVVESGHLAGAAVDVTETEPLPKESPMWQVENIHITPHTAGQYHLAATHDNIVNIVKENLMRFLAGKELINQVDFATGYKNKQKKYVLSHNGRTYFLFSLGFPKTVEIAVSISCNYFFVVEKSKLSLWRCIRFE